jgi:hypothetical protein
MFLDIDDEKDGFEEWSLHCILHDDDDPGEGPFEGFCYVTKIKNRPGRNTRSRNICLLIPPAAA